MKELKTWSDYFLAMATGAKPFDLRYDDGRNFSPGDTLYLREYDRETKIYSGKALIARITYVLSLKNFILDVDPNWKILGLANVKLVYDIDKQNTISAYTRDLDSIANGNRPFCFVYDQDPEPGQSISIAQHNTTKIAIATITHVKPVTYLSDIMTDQKAHIVSVRNVVYKG